MVALILESVRRYTEIFHCHSLGVLGHNFAAKICSRSANRNCGYLIRSRSWWRVVWRSQGWVGVLCPAEVGISTDEEEDSHNVTGTVEIQDVTGTLKINYWSTEVFGNKTNFDTLSAVSIKMTKKANSFKKRCLTSDQSDWTNRNEKLE
jgi:uncharacterized protein YaiE (UPF0345 family)